ncbi:MAG: RDD family protein [Pseudomonadota bacterium]
MTSDPHWQLPDPETAPEYYQDVAFKRFVAWIVDIFAVLVLSLLVLPFTAFVGLFFFGLIYLAVSFLYRFASIASYSATPGMRLVSIELRRTDGTYFDTLTAFLHTFLYLFFSTIFVLQIVSVGLMVISPRGQGLHDLALGTAALNKSRQY